MTEPDTYDLAPESDARVAVPAGAAPKSSVPPPTIPYVRVRPPRETDGFDILEDSAFRNLYLPIALTLVGCAAVLARMIYFKVFAGPQLEEAWRWTGFILLWNVVILLVGVTVIAKLTGIAFGPLPTATIKLAAIAVAPHAVTMIVEMLFGGEWHGIAIGWLLGIPFAWWLFMYLFELDAQEALICVSGTTVLRWLSYTIYWLS